MVAGAAGGRRDGPAGDAVAAVAAREEPGAHLAGAPVVVAEADGRRLGVDVGDGHAEAQFAAAGEVFLDEIGDEPVLRVDGVLLAAAEPVVPQLEFAAVVAEGAGAVRAAVAQHSGAEAVLGKHPRAVRAEEPGPRPGLHPVPAAAFEDERVDPGGAQQVGEHQPGRSRADDEHRCPIGHEFPARSFPKTGGPLGPPGGRPNQARARAARVSDLVARLITHTGIVRPKRTAARAAGTATPSPTGESAFPANLSHVVPGNSFL